MLALGDGAVGPLDRHGFDLVIDHRGQTGVDLARSFVALGEAVPLLTICALWAILVMVRRRGHTAALRSDEGFTASMPMIAFLGTAVLVSLIKPLVDRTGPAAAIRATDEPALAFPSGHAALAAAVLVTISVALTEDRNLARWTKAALVASGVTLAALVAVSTVVLFMHWPSDAIGGAAFGAAVALSVLLVGESLTSRRERSAV